MKQSIGYTATLNIAITFIIIVFGMIAATVIYFKSNKVSKVITDSIEKYEGYNTYSSNDIAKKMSALGYDGKSIEQSCISNNDITDNKSNIICTLVTDTQNNVAVEGRGKNGYCVYLCNEGEYYYYRIRTNMLINVPIINNLLNIPIYSNTSRLYDFETKFG